MSNTPDLQKTERAKTRLRKVGGIYGAATASRKIFFVQALPAIAALAAVLLC